jgi:putative endonuclease
MWVAVLLWSLKLFDFLQKRLAKTNIQCIFALALQQCFAYYRAISSAGSEHLVYTEGVGGSNPSSPTKVLRNKDFFYTPNLHYMPFFVYILYSLTKDKFYIGFTSNLEERIIRHNQKSKGFTGHINDWETMYTESFATKSEALAREKQIKSLKSRSKIQQLISNKD